MPVVRSKSGLSREYAMLTKVRSILDSLAVVELTQLTIRTANVNIIYCLKIISFICIRKLTNRRLNNLKAKSKESPTTLQSQQQLSINIKTTPSEQGRRNKFF